MKIAVIGAGLAGLTAAYRLKLKGNSVELFEARNRVGGRVFSVFVANTNKEFSVVELGGQGILDGGEAKNFLSLCEEMNLEIETSEGSLSAHQIYYEGKFYDFDEELNRYFHENPEIMNNIIDFSKSSPSLQAVIDKFFFDYPALRIGLSTKMQSYEGIDPNQQSIYRNFETFQIMLKGGLSKAHNTYKVESGKIIRKRILGGNSKLAMALAEKMGPNLHLNKTLIKLDKHKDKFHLLFSDKTEHAFDRVILAIPASVYEDIQLSENIAVHDRWERMKSLRYGKNYKILIPVDVEEAKSIWLLRKDLISSFYASNNILTVYCNRNISDLEKEFAIIIETFNIKNHIDPNRVISAKDENYTHYASPVMHIWQDDPYAKGSYSAYSITIAEDIDQKTIFANEEFKTLFRPTSDGLFFAGEHTTILDYIGTMEGAVESGERVARAVNNRLS